MEFKFTTFTFHPNKKGLRKILGDLEADIMDIVWQNDRMLVRDVFDVLKQKRKIAYTTVMTVMSRLAEKGLLNKTKSGQAYCYHAVVSKDAFMKTTLRQVINGLLDDFATPAISQFVESVGDENPQKMTELAKLIEAKKKAQQDV